MTDRPTLAEEGLRMNNDQIKYMVNRFLGWRLPEPWNPDNGISYQRPNYAHAPSAHDWPTGTNLFDSDQAAAMVRYMIEGLPDHPTPPAVEASDDLELVKLAIRDALIQAQPIFGQTHRLIDFMEPIARAAIAAIRREAATSPTQETVIEDLRDQLAQQSIDLHDAMAQLNEIENARDVAIEECARIADQSQADSMHEREISHDLETRACWLWAHDEAKQIANEIRALKSSPASPTELEKELTAALRKLVAEDAALSDGWVARKIDALQNARAVLAKATERGL